MKTVTHANDIWEVASEGVTRDGRTYCHLYSTTRGRSQANGWVPVQSCDWVDSSKLEEK